MHPFWLFELYIQYLPLHLGPEKSVLHEHIPLELHSTEVDPCSLQPHSK